MPWRPFKISLEMVSMGDRPDRLVIDELSARAAHPDAPDALVLDADRSLDIGVVERIVQEFQQAYRARYSEAAAEVEEDALGQVAERSPEMVPPVLVVLLPSPGPDDALDRSLQQKVGREERDDLYGRLAAAGAVVYERPPALPPEGLEEWLREELAQAYSQFWTDGQEFLPGSLARAEPPITHEPRVRYDLLQEAPDLAAYVEPAYRLSDEEFEALLGRGRNPNPLATGD